ncbi:MAG: iron-containing alcohol dehydrogenase family protein [Halovenus sp.]
MLPVTDAFEFEYGDSDIVYGRGRIDGLGERLGERDLENAFVVCGTNVGANDAVMDPVRRGLGDRLAGVFDETTPAKSAETVFDGIEAMGDVDADVLVGVGGGSSLDIARQMSVFAADGRPLSHFRSAAREGRAEPPATTEPLAPVVTVPTTFAGADFSSGGSIEVLPAEESPTDQPIRTGGSVMPVEMLYDPDLFETTPFGALAGSAMNGFDKGIETIYARDATPISDAAAVRGLRYLRTAFPRLPDDSAAMERAVVGIILVQFERRISVVHAFGHGFARRYPVQQGAIHAIVVPHVLRFIFDRVHGKREVLAEGLGVDAEGRSEAELAEAVVEEVTAVRDGLDLPTRLRDLDPVERDDFPDIAAFIVEDHGMDRAPEGLDASAEAVETVLHEAW